MFKSQPYLENTRYIQINLSTPLTFPANLPCKTGTIFMTGTMLISASILSLKLKQMEPTLVLTLNQLRLTVLSHCFKL